MQVRSGAKPDISSIEPFKIDIEQQILDDLKARLVRTRWPDEADGAGWLQGTSLSYMKELVDYWVGKFDWRVQERRLNGFPQFRANVKGWNIHFVHVEGKGPGCIPILISHGWPDTFAGQLKLVQYLTDPLSSGSEENDSFDVVIPSLPGYGFSDKRTSRGWVNRAEILHGLMTEVLGYRRFAARGSRDQEVMLGPESPPTLPINTRRTS